MAPRFWVGGTGTWDASDTTHWASGSGTAGGQSVPGSGDAVTIDASSGAGTITVNTTVSIQSLTCGTMGMTLDFSANNNNVNLTTSFSNSGAGTRTLNMGNGTWTLTTSGGGAVWTQNVSTNLTFNANSSTVIIAGTTSSTTGKSVFFGVTGGTVGAYNIVTLAANTGLSSIQLSNAATIATLNISAPQVVNFASALTITNAVSWNGTSSNLLYLVANLLDTPVTLTLGANGSGSWLGVRGLTFATGSFSATNSFDLGKNTLNGGTIAVPSGGGAVGVIG